MAVAALEKKSLERNEVKCQHYILGRERERHTTKRSEGRLNKIAQLRERGKAEEVERREMTTFAFPP